jgi:amino acid transporter
MARRGTILLGLAFFAFIAWIVAMSTDIAWADSATTEGFGDLIKTKTNMATWYTCVQQETNGETTVPICYNNGDDEISCQEYKDRFRVVQAFLVLAGIMTFFLMIASALDRFWLLGDVQHQARPRTILMAMFVCLILFTIVSFALAFSTPKTSLCGRGEFSANDGFSWGPSPFFTAIMCLLGIIGLIIAAVKDNHPKHVITAHTAHPAQPHAAHPARY